MHTRKQQMIATGRLVALAFVLSIVMAVELAAGNGFLKPLFDGELPWYSFALVLAMVLASTGAIVNAFTATMQPEPTRIAGTLASCGLAMTCGLEASHSVVKLPSLFYFGVSFVGELVYTYCYALVLLSFLKLSGRWSTRPPAIAAGAIVLVGLTGFIGQSFVSLEKVVDSLAVVRTLAVLGVFASVLGACAFHRPLRLDAKSVVESIRLRFPLRRDQPTEALALKIGLIGLGIDAVLGFAVRGHSADDASALVALTTFPAAWLAIFWVSLSELTIFTGEQRHGNVTAKLASHSARRLLRRHLTEKQAWAATVGIRTTSFTIDHDPNGALHQHLPASVMQIRSEEIQRCVNDVLQQMYLHSHVVGHRIFGALDTEASVRPCIDTLKMFACLYLDAGPLVERRIKGLTALLPIVDPGLARLLQPKDVNALIHRNLWFFHFNFGWIDQHVIHTPRSTRYDVRIDSLSSQTRQAMMDHLERTGGVGNYVWLGPEARDRLIQEAPIMKNIIEACPIAHGDEQGSSTDEKLMFTLKFEQLIPRLQRYFDLDSMRKSLLDFEPSPESARLLNLLSLQVNKARSPDEISEALGSLTSVPWKGFREKDNALQLILAAYVNLSKILLGGKPLHESDDPKMRELHEKVLDAVRMVGYPSQILHNAQISKIALRDVEALKTAASDTRNPRFHEAWLLMATTDYQKYKPEQRLVLIDFLAKVESRGGLKHNRLVQVKAVDALTSIGRQATPAEAQALKEALVSTCYWFAAAHADPDVCCHLLDAQVYIAMQLGQEFEFPEPVVAHLDRHFHQLQGELGTSHPKVIGLLSRWQEVRSRQANHVPPTRGVA